MNRANSISSSKKIPMDLTIGNFDTMVAATFIELVSYLTLHRIMLLFLKADMFVDFLHLFTLHK